MNQASSPVLKKNDDIYCFKDFLTHSAVWVLILSNSDSGAKWTLRDEKIISEEKEDSERPGSADFNFVCFGCADN